MTEKTKPFTELKEKIEKKNDILVKTFSLIKINENDNKKDKKFLGIKRHLFKKMHKKKGKGKENKCKKNLVITKAMEYFIKKAKIQVNENICIICFEKISFEQKHYLHCGHCFHCDCINKWIGMDKSKCPICKQNFECFKSFSENSLDEEEEDNNNNENVEFTNRGVVHTTNFSLDYFELLKLYFWILIIFFMFRGFYLRV